MTNTIKSKSPRSPLCQRGENRRKPPSKSGDIFQRGKEQVKSKVFFLGGVAPKKKITIAHSPDPDDAFMFYGLVHGGVTPKNWVVRHVLKDIQSLNRDARKGLYHVTAVSAAAFPSIADNYWVMAVGSSIGRGYGPLVICQKERKKDFFRSDWSGFRIATPGPETTALLLLRLARPGFVPVHTAFDKIPQAVREGRVDAGLVIHESQLTWAQEGFSKILDLGKWWDGETHLPLPLGLDVVRKDVGWAGAVHMANLLDASVRYAYAHKKEAVSYALKYGRGIDRKIGEKFVQMYVNEDTLHMGQKGEDALRLLFKMALEKKWLSKTPRFSVVHPDFAIK